MTIINYNRRGEQIDLRKIIITQKDKPELFRILAEINCNAEKVQAQKAHL